jgi:cytochrome c oxidase cbb3-type subunit 4
MSIYTLVSIATTVLTFLAFIGIVVWAYGKRRASSFEEAANAPFALPDDADRSDEIDNRAERQS